MSTKQMCTFVKLNYKYKYTIINTIVLKKVININEKKEKTKTKHS